MDAMTLARQLALPEPTLLALERTPLPEDHQGLYRLYAQEDFRGFSQAVADFDDLTMLRLLLSWVPMMQERYQALGIPEDIFRDNLKDFAIWCHHDLEQTGQPGFSHWRWVARSVRMNIIRLGRLQFERTLLREDLHLGDKLIPAGTPVLCVHIPAGEPLDPDAVLASFQQAKTFFPRYFGIEYSLLHCHTWLLAPALKELLPPESRILRFQALFQLYAEEDSQQAEERVFGTLAEDPALYPEHTSLQRALKACLLSGHRVGVGAGVRLL